MYTPSTYTVVFNLEKHLHELPRNTAIKKITVEVKNSKPYIHIRVDYCAKAVNVLRILRGRVYRSHANTWMAPLTLENLELLRDLQLPECVFTDLMKFCPATSQDCTLNIDSGTTDDCSSRSEPTGISTFTKAEPSPPSQQSSAGTGGISATRSLSPFEVTWREKHLSIRCPFHHKTVDLLKSLNDTWWSSREKVWVLKITIENVKALQEKLELWTAEDFEVVLDHARNRQEPETLELYVTPEFKQTFVLKISGHRADIAFVKTLPFRQYDATMRRWILPYDNHLVDRILAHFSKRGAVIHNNISSRKPVKVKDRHFTAHDKAYLLRKYGYVDMEALSVYIDAMIQLRYSHNTVRSYCSNFAAFLQFVQPLRIGEVHNKEIHQYLVRLSASGVSDSKLNTVVNAIKFYYEKAVYVPTIEIARIKRPKKSLKLPEILSMSEVDRLLRTLDNIKHTAMLYTLYSAGLRLSEMLDLRIRDVHWDRGQLFIRDSKGKKDRYVMLSPVLKDLLRYYFDRYQPKEYLFEGQSGDRPYSSRSVQSIVKRAADQAGLTRKVTPHLLRHCFATHLADGGTNIKYIQELLGHKDIKTTMIYTHISNHTLQQVRSPLDQLGIDQNWGEKRNNDIEKGRI